MSREALPPSSLPYVGHASCSVHPSPTSARESPRRAGCARREAKDVQRSTPTFVFLVCVSVSVPPRARGMGGGAPVVRVQWTVVCAGSRPPVGSYPGPAPSTVRHTAGAKVR